MTSAINLSEILPILSLSQALYGLLLAVVLVLFSAVILKAVRLFFAHDRSRPAHGVDEEASRLTVSPSAMAFQMLHRRR